LKRSLDGTEEAPMTEPVIVPCLFITGMAFEVSHGSVRIVAWCEMPDLGGEMRERRVVARLAMAKRSARHMHALLDEMLEDD
jgi:hypothetical protein